MSELIEHLKEVFEQFGTIRARRMFGGYGIYHNDLMFGLVADDVLYLKADAKSAKRFTDKGLSQFQYLKAGKPIGLSYYAAPVEIFDNPDEAKAWASLAYAAAIRAKNPAKKV